jgi:hypothetical protein
VRGLTAAAVGWLLQALGWIFELIATEFWSFFWGGGMFDCSDWVLGGIW